MSQVTWRASDDLVERVRAVAASEGRSVNEFLTRLATAAVDPATAGDGLERTRERLARAGLLAPPGPARPRPDREAVTAARKELAEGESLSSIVIRERG